MTDVATDAGNMSHCKNAIKARLGGEASLSDVTSD